MESQLAELQYPSCGVTYSCFILSAWQGESKYLLVAWNPGLSGSPEANYHSVLWVRHYQVLVRAPMCSSGCCHNQALTIMNLYVKLTYQISNVKNLGEWNRYALRQGGETWAGAAMPGVRHCNWGSGQLEFGKERRG